MDALDTARTHQTVVLASWLDRVVDLGLAGILFVAPLAMGGRSAPGRLLLAVLVAITAVSWLLARAFGREERAPWFWTGTEWLAAAAVLLVAAQLVEWPSGALGFLSPTIQELLPLNTPGDTASFELPVWERVSLAPHETRGGFAAATVYVMLFFVVLQRVRTRRDIETMLKALAIAGVGMATIGLAQRLFGNGKFLWFMEHPSRDTLVAVKGTFSNENHFVHFLALTLGPLIWWLVKTCSAGRHEVSRNSFGSRQTRNRVDLPQMLLVLGLGLVLLAALMSFSRGGLLMFGLAAMISIGLFAWQRRIGWPAIAVAATIMLVAVVAVWIHGRETLTRELATLGDMSVESLDQSGNRRKIWTADFKAVPDFALLGTGIGSHRFIYPTYLAKATDVQFTHAESGFLHLLVEAGGAGLGLLLVGIGFGGWWLAKSFNRNADAELQFLAVPLVSGFCVSLVHGVFDFNWFLPANMTLTLVLLALAARVWSFSAEDIQLHSRQVPRFVWSMVAVVVFFVSLLNIGYYIGPAKAEAAWNEYRAWSLATNRFEAKSIGPGRQRSLGYVDGDDPHTLDTMIGLLEETLRENPKNGRAHARMAALCMRQFELLMSDSEMGMALPEIRDAAISSEFESHAAMTDWFNQVVGEHRAYVERVLWHCRQAIKLTPTEGRAYLLLSEVAFLDERLVGSEFELIRQAWTTRPHDPAIQFAFGRQKLLAGDTGFAMELWKQAFRHGVAVRKQVIAATAFQAPPEQLVELFQPGVDGLGDLFDYYRRREFAEPMRSIGAIYVEELERQGVLMSGRRAGELWFNAQFVHATLGNVEDAAAAAKNAVQSYPSEFRNHEAYGLRLRDVGRFTEAAEQFSWCQARRPHEPRWSRMVEEMRTLRRQAEWRAAERAAAAGLDYR